MSGSADRLLKLIYEWLEEAKECSSNLRALARELESLRKSCNAWETVGSTVAVAGSVLSIGAAFFTGGASLFLLGAVGGGLGAGVSVVTKITEQFKSSSKLARAKEIDKRCNTIVDKIKELSDELRKDCPSSKADEQDQYVVKEFLKAMARRRGLDGQIGVKKIDKLVRVLGGNAGTINKCSSLYIGTQVITVLSTFLLCWTLLSKRGKKIVKVAIQRASRFLGGVVGLAFSLPEAIDNWIEAIQNKHVTKASKSLRDTATKIDETVANLSKTLEETYEEMDSSSSSSDEEEDELKMALVNARSVYKFRKGDDALCMLIQNNNLDVLLITETWLPEESLSNNVLEKILPPNYSFWNFPRIIGRGGGVAIVFSIKFVCIPILFNETSTFEYVAGCLIWPQSRKSILILNIYRPPPTPCKKFFDELRTLLQFALNCFRRVIIGGDFNIWVDCPKLNVTRTFLELLISMGLIQHVSQPTHIKGHILDLVIARGNVRVTDVSVWPNDFSDHSTVFFTVHSQNIVD